MEVVRVVGPAGERHYYTHGSYVFLRSNVKERNLRHTQYLKCYAPTCGARAKVVNGDVAGAVVYQIHNHGPTPTDLDNVLLLKQCLDAAAADPYSLRQIFDAALRRYRNADYTWPAMEERMRLVRKGSLPRTTSDTDVLFAELRARPRFSIDMAGTPFFREVVRTVEVDRTTSTNFVFVSHGLQGLLERQVDVLLLDGTFAVVPHMFKQLLTIHVYAYNVIFPVIYVLMERKTEPSYRGVLELVTRFFPGLDPRRIMTDFETALRNALSASFPNAQSTGCFFHYCQAIIHRAMTIGLASAVRSPGSEGKSAIAMLSGLPALPLAQIPRGMDICRRYIVNATIGDGERRLLHLLATYVDGFWLHRVGPDSICINELEVRTNNGVESFHHQLRMALGRHRGIWEFIARLIHMEFRYSKELDAAAEGRQVRIGNRGRRARRALRIPALIANLPQEPSDSEVARFLRAVGHKTTGGIPFSAPTTPSLPASPARTPSPSAGSRSPTATSSPSASQYPSPVYSPSPAQYPPPSPVYSPSPVQYPPPSPVYSPPPAQYPPPSPVYSPSPVQYPPPSPVYSPPPVQYPPPSPVYSPSPAQYPPPCPVYSPSPVQYPPPSPVYSPSPAQYPPPSPVYSPSSDQYPPPSNAPYPLPTSAEYTPLFPASPSPGSSLDNPFVNVALGFPSSGTPIQDTNQSSQAPYREKRWKNRRKRLRQKKRGYGGV